MLSLEFRHRVRAKLWLLPLLVVLAAFLLSLVTVAIDRHYGDHLIPRSITGSASAASAILSTVASAMITMTTLVLTITMVAVQLAMGQFSPRIVRALLHDRSSQLTFGLFAATFTFAILALREVQAVDSGAVPGITVLTAYLLMFASIVTLFLYIHSSGNSLRAAGLIDLVSDQLRVQLDRCYPAGRPPRADPAVIPAAEPGIVCDLDRRRLVKAARQAGCALELVPMLGDFVPAGADLFRIHGDAGRLDRAKVCGLVILGNERKHKDDPTYGFRELVDIGERCLAQPFTDPTTAVMVIDRLHDCLRQIAPRPFPDGRLRDADGEVRLVERSISWDGLVRLAFDELRLAGAASPQVPRRIRAVLEDLRTVVPAERRPALDRQLTLLTAAVERSYPDRADVEAALVSDHQGIGSGPDLELAAAWSADPGGPPLEEGVEPHEARDEQHGADGDGDQQHPKHRGVRRGAVHRRVGQEHDRVLGERPGPQQRGDRDAGTHPGKHEAPGREDGHRRDAGGRGKHDDG
jgi:uncharacterized membrane protein